MYKRQPGTYHRIKRAYFEELDPRGEKVGESSLEFSIPSELSHIHFRGVDYPVSNNMTSLIPVINTSDGILIGIARFDAAAVQNYSTQLYGYRSSQYATLPLCSLGEGMDSFASAADFIVEGVCKSLGLKVIRIGRLGGMYFPSLGAPLKTVESGWIEADAESAIANPLFSWVPLRESYLPLFSDPDQRHLRRFLVCGPTLTTSLRFAHSVGLV